MVRFCIILILLSLAGLLLADGLLNVALAHSERPFRPPGVMPPTNREPTDPPEPPTEGGGGNGGGTVPPGGVTPPPGAKFTPNPRLAPRTGATANPGQGGTSTGSTPNHRAKVVKTLGYERWEYWWIFNRESYLRLREKLHREQVVSGSIDWLLGKRDKDASRLREAPTAQAVARSVVPVLRDALGDSFFDVRASAVIALGKTADRSVVADLIGALADPRPSVSESAALALGMAGERDAVEPLRDLLFDTTAGRRLVKKPQGVPYRTRALAAVGLGLIGDADVIPDLLEIADPRRKDAHSDVPIAAIVAIGSMGEKAREAVPDLGRILVSPQATDLVRSYAAIALGKVGDATVVPMLRGVLQRQKGLHTPRSAILSLGRLASPDDPITIGLLRNTIAKGDDPQAAHWACISLGRIGGPLAAKELKRIVTDGRGSLQAFGALGLATLHRDTPVPHAVRYLREGLARAADSSVQGAFAIALGIAGASDAAADLQRILVRDGEPALRGYAAVGLGMMNARAAIPEIRVLLGESGSDPDLQRSMAIALGLMGDRDVVNLLVDILARTRNEYARSSAALALGTIGDHTAIEPLTRIVQNRNGAADMTRSRATAALGLVAERTPVPILQTVTEDSNYRALVETTELLLRLL